MQENHKILVVDDDMRLRALLERYLTEQGFQVRSVANAEQMDRLLTRESFHLMVLDLMLPGEDGLSICRRLRSQSNPMPIIMVTAKGEEVDRIVGLEIGADDYIPKPFNPRELLARIRAVLRRQANELPGAPSQEEAVISFGKFKSRAALVSATPLPASTNLAAVASGSFCGSFHSRSASGSRPASMAICPRVRRLGLYGRYKSSSSVLLSVVLIALARSSLSLP